MTSELSAQPASIRCATTIVAELITAGVTDFVLCPGSRSAPLAFAVAAAERVGLARLTVRLDERSAGFWAVGLARGGAPAAVITTSGTAVADLHPAVLEASHAALPMLLITADRPATMINTGANQTTDQHRIFGVACRSHAVINSSDDDELGWQIAVRRSVADALGSRSANPGPVQLNVALAEPLVPDQPIVITCSTPLRGAVVDHAGQADDQVDHDHVDHSRVDHARVDHPVSRLPYRAGTVVIAGAGAGAEPRLLAEAAGLPLFAEPSSGARTGPNAIASYRLLLDSCGGQIERVIVYGRPTLSRMVNQLCRRAETVVVSRRPDWPDPLWHVDQVAWRVSVEPDHTEWLSDWRELDAALQAQRHPANELSGPAIASLIMTEVAGPVVIGSSNPIRDADLAPIGSNADIHANRGLAGIDGTSSTAGGLASARRQSVTVLVGDLTFLHDLTGLLRGVDEPVHYGLRIVVVNDVGGSIFAGLEQGQPQYAADFERLFGAGQRVELSALAEGVGANYHRCTTPDELRSVLQAPVAGIEIVECPVSRADRRSESERWAQLAATLRIQRRT